MCISVSFIRLDFIYDLFEKVGSRNNEEKMGTARRKPTVSSQFRVSGTYHQECGKWLIHHTLTSLVQVLVLLQDIHHVFGFSIKKFHRNLSKAAYI